MEKFIIMVFKLNGIDSFNFVCPFCKQNFVIPYKKSHECEEMDFSIKDVIHGYVPPENEKEEGITNLLPSESRKYFAIVSIVKETILKSIDSNKEFDVQEVIQKIPLDEKIILGQIDKLAKSGDIYESKKGFYRLL